MPLKQKRPGSSQGGGGGGKPLLQLAGLVGKATTQPYNPNVSIKPEQTVYGPTASGEALPPNPAEINLQAPTRGQAFWNPQAVDYYNNLKTNFALGQYNAQQELAQRLAAVAAAGRNQVGLEDTRFDHEKQLANLKAEQEAKAEEVKNKNKDSSSRQQLYLDNLKKEREIYFGKGYGDRETYLANEQPLASSTASLKNRENQAILGMDPNRFIDLNQTRYTGDAEKQAVTNDNTRAMTSDKQMETTMRPFLQIAGNAGVVNPLSGQTIYNSEPLKEEPFKAGGIKMTGGFKPVAGGVNGALQNGNQGQPNQSPTQQPVFTPQLGVYPKPIGPEVPDNIIMQNQGVKLNPIIPADQPPLNALIGNWLQGTPLGDAINGKRSLLEGTQLGEWLKSRQSNTNQPAY